MLIGYCIFHVEAKGLAQIVNCQHSILSYYASAAEFAQRGDIRCGIIQLLLKKWKISIVKSDSKSINDALSIKNVK